MKSKICEICGEEKSITNFNKKGINTTKTVIYRDTKCRKCLRSARIKAGLCATCGRPSTSNHKQCRICLDIMNKSAKKRARLDRELALQHYGNECQYCGEKEEIFLTFDHIANDGAKHRRGIKGQNRGHNLPTWLRRNSFPEGFQILCYNCNCAKNHHSTISIKEAIQRSRTTIKKALLQKLLQAIKEKRITI